MKPALELLIINSTTPRLFTSVHKKSYDEKKCDAKTALRTCYIMRTCVKMGYSFKPGSKVYKTLVLRHVSPHNFRNMNVH